MPKVKENYFKEKQDKILDAAFSVCMRKPVYYIRMQDIIFESGLSQGGIYRYYKNIDDILFSLMKRGAKNMDVKGPMDSIVSSQAMPEQIISEIFTLIHKTVLRNIVGYGKIYFEFTTILANNPKKYAEYRSVIDLSASSKYILEKTYAYVERNVTNGYFKPKLPLQDIFALIVTSFNGIERDVLMSECYQLEISSAPIAGIDAKKLTEGLGMSLICLLGGKSELFMLPGNTNA